MSPRRSTVLCVSRLLLALGCLWASAQVYEPLLMQQRTWMVALVLLLASLIFAWELKSKSPPLGGRALHTSMTIGVLALSLLAFLHTAQQGAQLWWARKMTLEAPSHVFRELGRHLIVGYTDVNEISHLAAEGMIGGVYISKRNIQGRSTAQMRLEIAGLQQLRQSKGLPPLWIAADQEGGVVSHLSPPLPLLAPLSQIAKSLPDPVARSQAIFSYAALQGRQLASIGVNLNLAPVVDVNRGIVNPDDRYSRISERAISSNPADVTDIAGDFCAGLAQNNVHCTLKHFPGLGRIYADTHLDSATLTTPIAQLSSSDWVPFKTLMKRPGTLTMLGHVRLAAVDAQFPASFSPGVVDMLRHKWGYGGLLITDDFCMGPVYGSSLGMGGAAVQALNSGVDLILISYDPSQYYPVMRELIQAQADGRLQQDSLDNSARRLQKKWSMAE